MSLLGKEPHTGYNSNSTPYSWVQITFDLDNRAWMGHIWVSATVNNEILECLVCLLIYLFGQVQVDHKKYFFIQI